MWVGYIDAECGKQCNAELAWKTMLQRKALKKALSRKALNRVTTHFYP
jgi:hypothetical protein